MTCFQGINSQQSIFVSKIEDDHIRQEKRASNGFLIEAFRKIEGGMIRFAGRKYSHKVLENFDGFYVKVKWNNAVEMKVVVSETGLEINEVVD